MSFPKNYARWKKLELMTSNAFLEKSSTTMKRSTIIQSVARRGKENQISGNAFFDNRIIKSEENEGIKVSLKKAQKRKIVDMEECSECKKILTNQQLHEGPQKRLHSDV